MEVDGGLGCSKQSWFFAVHSRQKYEILSLNYIRIFIVYDISIKEDFQLPMKQIEIREYCGKNKLHQVNKAHT